MERRVFDKAKIDDLVLLNNISEDEILGTLRRRFESDLIYTTIGPVLLSVNPFHDMGRLYEGELARKYSGRFPFELAPHVFAVAEAAYRNLCSMQEDQCIVVSGESGAGKTEAAKRVMEYIALVSGGRASTKGDTTVRDRLLQTNPVLEAFGNAKTLRNENSSRFGKYMELQFLSGAPVGGKITNYLLEKPRVVAPGAGERAFHVFYQLLSGGSAADKSQLGVTQANDYELLRGGGRVLTLADRGASDANDFAEMRQAMATMGFTVEHQLSLLSAVAAVLNLSNLSFTGGDGGTNRARGGGDGKACAVAPAARGALTQAARLLGVPEAGLERALTHRTIATRSEEVTSPIAAVECAETRDALSKALYSRAFGGLVKSLNEAIGGGAGKATIGVLDIYGFEVFETNSFEQLCINYTNEKLQQYFIELTLKAEQEEYAKEGIAWTPIDYFDNKRVCELLEGKKPTSVVELLDEESIMPQATDETLLAKMGKNLAFHKHFTTDMRAGTFTLKHYAGDVVYSPVGFLDKNRDALYRDLQQLMHGSNGAGGSSSKFLAGLFKPTERAAAKWREQINSGVAKRPPTVAAQYRTAINELVAQLTKCAPHYIRTIKPNDEKRAGHFDLERVRHQVRYLGLLENVRVRRAGFAHRETYKRFESRYKMVSAATWPRGTGDARASTQTILAELQISGKPGSVQMGKTKVFLKEPQSLFTLEAAREACLERVARTLQGGVRKWLMRLNFTKWQAWLKEVWRKVWFQRANWALKMVQRLYRAYLVRKPYLALRAQTRAVLGRGKRRCISDALYQQGDYYGAAHDAEVLAALRPSSSGNAKGAKLLGALGGGGGGGGGGDDDFSAVLFADSVEKVSCRRKLDPRVLVVTQRAAYLLAPPTAEMKQQAATKGLPAPTLELRKLLPLTVLVGASLSSNADGFVALHVSDAVACKVQRKAAGGADWLLHCARKAELVRVLADAVHAAGGGGGGSAALQAAGGGAFRVTVSEAVGYQAHHDSLFGAAKLSGVVPMTLQFAEGALPPPPEHGQGGRGAHRAGAALNRTPPPGGVKRTRQVIIEPKLRSRAALQPGDESLHPMAARKAPMGARMYGGGAVRAAGGAAARVRSSFQGVQLPGRKPPPRRAAAPPPLPEGWAEDVDPSSGNKYFYNEATGETTWERPFGRGVESMRR